MMVELRWLKRWHHEYRESGEPLYKGFEPVLQYRQQRGSDYIGELWTDWQDVPTVTEGAE